MNFKKFHPSAKLPMRQSPEAAGYDLHAVGQHMVGAVAVIPTGVGVQIPKGYYGRICDRSGHAVKHGLTVMAGIIDQDYTGEIMVVMTCTKGESKSIADGERMAQLVISPCVMEDSKWVEELDTTERGSNGFGSSGV